MLSKDNGSGFEYFHLVHAAALKLFPKNVQIEIQPDSTRETNDVNDYVQ